MAHAWRRPHGGGGKSRSGTSASGTLVHIGSTMQSSQLLQRRQRLSGPQRRGPRKVPSRSPTQRMPVRASAQLNDNVTAVRRAPVQPAKEVKFEVDSMGRQRVKWDHDGWNYWDLSGKRIHWLASGPEDAPPVILVHGYGASAYHWRYQVPELAKQFRVYAVCLLGFGFSTKALSDYTNGKQWTAQLTAFIEQVVGGQPAVLVGNSLGGYASLATASLRPDLVRAVALLNGAGPMRSPGEALVDPDAEPSAYDQLITALTGLVKRVVLFFAFIQAKQPGRIREVLSFVYVNQEQIDDELVESIVQPATDPAACEVFFRLNHRLRPPVTVDVLLSRMQAARVPLLLLWGWKDPWITPSRAQAVQQMYPQDLTRLVPLYDAGHCPHDDSPQAANQALLSWLAGLPEAPAGLLGAGGQAGGSLAAVAARLRATGL